MLLRGIAFAEARRNSARRVFKNRDKTQGCERDLSHDGSLARHVRMKMMAYQPMEVPLSSIFSNSFVSYEKWRKHKLQLVTVQQSPKSTLDLL